MSHNRVLIMVFFLSLQTLSLDFISFPVFQKNKSESSISEM
jgi:hypothetical protein